MNVVMPTLLSNWISFVIVDGPTCVAYCPVTIIGSPEVLATATVVVSVTLAILNKLSEDVPIPVISSMSFSDLEIHESVTVIVTGLNPSTERIWLFIYPHPWSEIMSSEISFVACPGLTVTVAVAPFQAVFWFSKRTLYVVPYWK